MQRHIFICCILLIGLISCIGDDVVDDFVEPQIRVVNAIDTLAVGDTYQLEVQFFNNVGSQEKLSMINWSSDDENVVVVSDEGLLWAREKGEALVTASVNYDGSEVSETFRIVVDEETVAAPTMRMGSLNSTSSYTLKGNFVLETTENGVRLAFDEEYETDDVLPGLYIYLTNNPNTVSEALVIGEVTHFKGVHEYEIDDVMLNDYSHVLYFCKPFNVKVGDGAFE